MKRFQSTCSPNLQVKSLTSVKSNSPFTLCVSWRSQQPRGENRGEGPLEKKHLQDASGWVVDWHKVKSLSADLLM